MSLSADEALALLRLPERVELKTKPNRWLTVHDYKALVEAVKHDADIVYLPIQQREFNIRYYPDGKVWVYPSTGFVPCGYYTIPAIRREVQDYDALAGL